MVQRQKGAVYSSFLYTLTAFNLKFGLIATEQTFRPLGSTLQLHFSHSALHGRIIYPNTVDLALSQLYNAHHHRPNCTIFSLNCTFKIFYGKLSSSYSVHMRQFHLYSVYTILCTLSSLYTAHFSLNSILTSQGKLLTGIILAQCCKEYFH